VMSTHADVLALKYAQAFYGVDKMVANRLGHPGRPNITPQVGGFRLVPSDGVVTAKRILFVGVRELYNFGYREIREFSIKVLSSLAGEASTTRVLALTLHGPGFGLDERECFLSEVAGVADAIASGDYPAQLEIVKIVEHNAGRARRLNGLLEKYFPGGNIDADPQVFHRRIGEERSETLRAIGYDSGQKPHVFVAMPFAAEMSDLYHYGIERAVSSSDYLCERIDQIPSTGDVLPRIKEKIKTSRFVVAELTGANPNVFLEVGYAWGCDVPTILLIKKDELRNLSFDIVGQRYIAYENIQDLERRLFSELKGLAGQA